MCYDIAQVYILISDVIHLVIQETDWKTNGLPVIIFPSSCKMPV